ncbi:hypothetical protein ACXU4B_07935 [Dyella soli]|uniref:Uncharacterized protein n=1 Tax=Dyella soli TaxID=522319 RepID=A0A4R0YPX3_9GAMM|nr:hypothetical protein [Dyella soli]TCI10896.1 hypothetical protein EZM97_18835 [Dyella soli]
MSSISVETWALGPDTDGQWQGHWNLVTAGEAIPGRYGQTSYRYRSETEARGAAMGLGKMDRRNMRAILRVFRRR